MSSFTFPLTNNVKIHFKISQSECINLINILQILTYSPNIILTKHQNFIIVKVLSPTSLTFTLFCKEGYINATGIKNFISIASCLNTFQLLFNIPPRNILSLTVDNSTSSGTFGKNINLAEVKRKINSIKYLSSVKVSSKFNLNFFPAVFIKFVGKGTIAIFQTGKYNIIGAKCPNNILHIFQSIQTLLETMK